MIMNPGWPSWLSWHSCFDAAAHEIVPLIYEQEIALCWHELSWSDEKLADGPFILGLKPECEVGEWVAREREKTPI